MNKYAVTITASTTDVESLGAASLPDSRPIVVEVKANNTRLAIIKALGLAPKQYTKERLKGKRSTFVACVKVKSIRELFNG